MILVAADRDGTFQSQAEEGDPVSAGAWRLEAGVGPAGDRDVSAGESELGEEDDRGIYQQQE